MYEQDLALQYVCTHQEAHELVQMHQRFWVLNCSCREKRGRCARSRMDVCLIFAEEDAGSEGSGRKEVDRAFVEGILQEAQDKHLVSRPFRNKARTATNGICFCCDDCCGYFLKPSERCDPGKMVQETNLEECSDCGTCVEVCYFRARAMGDDHLVLSPDNCYGCGLCVAVCPQDCIEMIPRL